MEVGGGDDDPAGRRAGELVEQLAGEEVRREVVHGQREFDPVCGLRPRPHREPGVVRENVEPIVRFAEFGGQIANRRLGRQIGAVKPDRPGRRVALGGERLATLRFRPTAAATVAPRSASVTAARRPIPLVAPVRAITRSSERSFDDTGCSVIACERVSGGVDVQHAAASRPQSVVAMWRSIRSTSFGRNVQNPSHTFGSSSRATSATERAASAPGGGLKTTNHDRRYGDDRPSCTVTGSDTPRGPRRRLRRRGRRRRCYRGSRTPRGFRVRPAVGRGAGRTHGASRRPPRPRSAR